jgi:hypothetical protein
MGARMGQHKKMKEWIIANALAEEEELTSIAEAEAKQTVRQEKNKQQPGEIM